MTGRDGEHGWPALSRMPVSMPVLRENATPLEIARAYASVVASWHTHWGQMVEALEWLRGRDLALDAKVESLRDDLLTEIRAGHMRDKLPSLSEFEPELTATGIRLPRAAWSGVQQRIADLEAQLEERRLGESSAKARESGIRFALSELEAKRKRARATLTFLLPFVVAGAAFLSWLLTHFHLLP